MSDDLVKQSIAELQDIVRCRCHQAYRDRGMQDPDCECDSADAVQAVVDRIEELEAKLAKNEALMQAGFAEYERRLGKAVDAIDGLLAILPDDEGPEIDYARTTFVELKGEDQG